LAIHFFDSWYLLTFSFHLKFKTNDTMSKKNIIILITVSEAWELSARHHATYVLVHIFKKLETWFLSKISFKWLSGWTLNLSMYSWLRLLQIYWYDNLVDQFIYSTFICKSMIWTLFQSKTSILILKLRMQWHLIFYQISKSRIHDVILKRSRRKDVLKQNKSGSVCLFVCSIWTFETYFTWQSALIYNIFERIWLNLRVLVKCRMIQFKQEHIWKIFASSSRDEF